MTPPAESVSCFVNTDLVPVKKGFRHRTTSPFTEFPAELFLPVISFLHLRDINQLSLTTKRINSLIKESKVAIFENLIQRDFDPDIVAAYRFPINGVWGSYVMMATGLRGISTDDFGFSFGRGGSKRGGRNKSSASLKEMYLDLHRFSSWLGLSSTDSLLYKTVQKMANFQSKTLYSAFASSPTATSTAHLLTGSWMAVAAQCIFRGAVVDNMKVDGARSAQELVLARTKLDDAAIRLKRHGIRILMLMFAATVGSKKEAKRSVKPQQSPTASSPIGIPGSGIPTTVISSISMVAAAAAAPSAPASHMAAVNAVSQDLADRLALVPIRNLPSSYQNIVMQAKWRMLREFDSDTLLGLGLAVTAAHELLVGKFLSAGSLDHQAAVLHAHNAIGLGPKVVSRVLTASNGEAIRAILENPIMRPGTGPFFLNVVKGVLEERDLMFEH